MALRVVARSVRVYAVLNTSLQVKLSNFKFRSKATLANSLLDEGTSSERTQAENACLALLDFGFAMSLSTSLSSAPILGMTKSVDGNRAEVRHGTVQYAVP